MVKTTVCTKCGEDLDTSHDCYCRSCLRVYAAEWRSKNRDRTRTYQRDYYAANKAKHKVYREKSRYKIDPEAFRAEKMAEQDGRCAICTRPFSETKRGAFIDHDHKTDAPRGLLCDTCNVGVGAFKESLSNLRQAMAYLEYYSSVTQHEKE